MSCNRSPSYVVSDGDTPQIKELIVDAQGQSITLPVASTVELIWQKVSPTVGVVNTSTGTLVAADPGEVEYTFTAGQLAMTAGQSQDDVYHWQFRVTDVGYQLTAPAFDNPGVLTVKPTATT